MALNWYPVVDASVCVKCGSCSKKCLHGVYDIDKASLPVVVQPQNCIDHCHGCGNICPEGAITYAGEDTGWAPPKVARNNRSIPGSVCKCC